MINRINIKEPLILAAFITTMFFTTSCKDNRASEDAKIVSEEQNEARFDDNDLEYDAQFLVNAAEINLEEIQLAQLAQQKGSVAHVKELGKMMEDAHTRSQSDLVELAKTKNVSIPTTLTDDNRKAYNGLNEKSGKDFDKAYADRMVNGHKDTIEIFEDASVDAQDSEIKNWATAKLPELRKHLDHSIECQKKCGKM
jgi:putative membrane protein